LSQYLNLSQYRRNMTLEEIIKELLLQTTGLHSALESDPDGDHGHLLSARAAALQSFEDLHRLATPAECTASISAIKKLQEADAVLRDFCRTKKEAYSVQANQIGQRLATSPHQDSGPSRKIGRAHV